MRIVPTPAAPAKTVQTGSGKHPDAKLFKLEKRFLLAAATITPGSDDPDQFEADCAALDAIEEKMAATPATTFDGLFCKARVARHWDREITYRAMADSIFDDLERLGAHPQAIASAVAA